MTRARSSACSSIALIVVPVRNWAAAGSRSLGLGGRLVVLRLARVAAKDRCLLAAALQEGAGGGSDGLGVRACDVSQLRRANHRGERGHAALYEHPLVVGG